MFRRKACAEKSTTLFRNAVLYYVRGGEDEVFEFRSKLKNERKRTPVEKKLGHSCYCLIYPLAIKRVYPRVWEKRRSSMMPLQRLCNACDLMEKVHSTMCVCAQTCYMFEAELRTAVTWWTNRRKWYSESGNLILAMLPLFGSLMHTTFKI